MTVTVLIGDVRDKLRTLSADSFDCVVTSPPYWGLRDYGTGKWVGGDPTCDHRSPTMRDGRDEERAKLAGSDATNSYQLKLAHRSACGKCGAVKVDQQIGLEPTLGEHLAVMVDVFREVRRVLKPSGTLWLNYGDCYATSPNGRSAADTKAAGNDDRTFRDKPFSTIGGTLKAKDLAMIPNRLAIALQEPMYVGQITSELDRVWLAAMIDAEGSIYIHRQPEGTKTGRDGRRTQDNFCVGIALSNCHESIVRKAAAICSKDNVHCVVAEGGHRRDHYHWRVTGNVAKTILTEIYPYLVGKKREARIAIACPPSGDLAAATWAALKDLHKGRPTDMDAKPPNVADLWEQGWWVRAENIWGKSNPMPESIRDRPATAHEKIFMLTKSARYFYAADEVRQGRVGDEDANTFRGGSYVGGEPGPRKVIGNKRIYKTPDGWDTGPGGHGSRHRNGREKGESVAEKIAKQDATAGAAGAAGASSGRRMAGFNERWDAKERALAKQYSEPYEGQSQKDYAGAGIQDPSDVKRRIVEGKMNGTIPDGRNLRNYEPAPPAVWVMGTSPFSDAHFATFPPELVERCLKAGCPKGGSVLDPFGGAGTTALVADQMQLDATIIELNPAYVHIAVKRIEADRGAVQNLLDPMVVDLFEATP